MAFRPMRRMDKVVLVAAVGVFLALASTAKSGDVPVTGPDLDVPAMIKLGSSPEPRLVPAGPAVDNSAKTGKASAIPSTLPETPSEPATATRHAGGTTSDDRAGQTRSPQGSTPVPESLKPIPDPQNGGPVTIEAAGFKGVTPGVSTADEVQKAWGPPKDVVKKGNTVIQSHRVEPFERIEATLYKGRVTSIVIRLERSFPAQAVARQLDLGAIRPVLVSNTLGEILGQSYPERGVLFAFDPAAGGGKPTMKVAQIILEPVTAEPFVLRAETNLDTQPESSLSDLEQAIKLAPTNARAQWLRARVLMLTGDLSKALSASDESVRLEPEDPRYRVTRAQILGPLGRFAEAAREAERAVATSQQRPHVKARALCLLGDMASSGLQPDYKRAVGYHTEAIKLADTLTGSPHPAIRLSAKEVLVDAHLGAAQDIAWGSWNQKEASVAKWLQRAAAVADDLIKKEGGSAEYRFRVAARGLTAYVGLQGKLDPTELADEASKVGQELIGSATSPTTKQQVQWDLGMALYDAVQLYQMRKEHETALEYGQQAASFLEQGIARRQNHPADSYFLGRLYFRLGAIHAVSQEKNHRSAVTWFDKGAPLLEKSIASIDATEKGRLGETLVSMGVSYWEVGQRDKSVDLTSRGITLMEQAVREGTLEKASLEIPYGNLATMYRHLGKTDEANRYLEKASKNSNTIRR